MDNQTITEKIRSAKKYLGVSRREMMNQMIQFYESGDREGMRQMFEAYRDWEFRVRARKRTIEETLDLAKDNFDCVASVADCFVATGDVVVGMVLSQKLPKNIPGPITQFYREAISYQNSSTNLN